MPTELFVTLSEALRVAKQPLKEAALWALLHLAGSAVQASLNSGGTGPGLLITPDSVLLYPGGRLEVLSGVHDEAKSKFTAPEVDHDDRVDLEKMYVYSIGATLSVALESTVGSNTSHLYQLLTAMMSSEPSKRPSLQSVMDTSARQSAQGGANEINTLVTFVLDTEQHASSGGEGDDNEESLEAELKAVMSPLNSESRDCISNVDLTNQGFQTNSQALERSTSSQSIDGVSSLGGLSTSSLPLTYNSSVQKGLDKDAGQSWDTPSHSLCNPLSLSLQFQDIGVLASTGRGQLLQGSIGLQNQQKTTSLPACTTGPSTTSGDFDKHQIEKDVGHSVDTSYPLLQFQSDAYLDDLPSLPPPPIPTLPQDEPQPLSGSLLNTPTSLDRIDSLLQHGTTNRPASEATASFDYSDLDSSRHNKPPSRCSSGEEFEFCQPLLPLQISEESEIGDATALTGHASETQISRVHRESDTRRALDEALEHLDNNNWEQTSDGEDRDPSHLYAKVDKKRGRKELDKDDVSALYATIDKSKKTGRVIQTERECTNHAPHLDSESDNERLCLRPPMPLPQDSTTSISQHPSSGIYEEVESLRAQIAVVDTSGYTEVGGRRAESGYEVGYNGTGSLHKLCNVLGPEFSTMTGKGTKVAEVAGSLPEGRSNVEVVMLNGKAVKFTVGISATVTELFEQVVSYQSLKETHIFGLALRKDRDDIFLDTTSKLVRHAPPHWAQSTHHTSFTVFFRVKHYVENVSQLLQPLTRHLYYLQLRKDLIEGMMFCHDEPALQLAALALQAEKGDCIGNRAAYFRMDDYVPARVIDKLGRQCLRDLLPSIHKERQGLSQPEAELEFLKEVQKLPEYGMVFYRVAKKKNGEIGSVWLGFCVRGLVVFDVHRGVKTATQHCAWRKTSNISFAHRKFVINLHDHPEPLVFYTKNYKRARYLLEFSKACHKFHLVWAKKTLGTSSSTTSTTGPGTTKLHTSPVEAIVEYPSVSRPSSVVEEMASTYLTPSPSPHHHPPVKMETVSVTLNRGEADGFGFSIAGSSHQKEVYVVKVATNGANNGRLLNGDRIVAINGQSVESYSQTRALLKRCGSQLTIDIQRKIPQSTDQEILPPGQCIHVEVNKEGGAIGVRIAGGRDKLHSRGLVYIKCLTPNTAASRSGALQEGDIVLQVNGVTLKGMTHRQAANTVVHAGDNVNLQLLRPCNPHWWKTGTDGSLSGVAEETFSPPSPPLETHALSPVPPLSPPSPEPNEHSSSLAFTEEQ